jgi:oxygen-independent coproporphyrinogen-3 oxidase
MLTGEDIKANIASIRTVFERLRDAGKLVVPDAEAARALFDTTREVCERHGLPAYEISNHARPGAECRHNLVYWRYGEYVGVGPGAHGRVVAGGQRIASQTEKNPELWLRRVTERADGMVAWDPVEPEQQSTEALLMGLRLMEGVDLARIEAMSSLRLDPRRVLALEQNGFLQRDQKTLKATPKGRLVLNAVLKELLA